MIEMTDKEAKEILMKYLYACHGVCPSENKIDVALVKAISALDFVIKLNEAHEELERVIKNEAYIN